MNLFKALKFIDSVSVSDWNTTLRLIDAIKNKDAIVIEAKYAEDWKKDHILDLTQISHWQVGEENRHLTFMVDKQDDVICQVNLYSHFHGYYNTLEISAVIKVKRTFLNHVSKQIAWKFDFAAEDAYEEFLEAQKEAWKRHFKKTILSN